MIEGLRSCLHDPQTPLASPGAEVANGTANLIKESGLPKYLWAEAASYTIYTLNRVLSKVSPVTPFEAWHNKKPNLSHLRVFGPIAYLHVPKADRRKLDPTSIRCIFVGYSHTQKAYRFWNPANKTIKISGDVTFDEHHRLVGIPEKSPECTEPETRPVSAQEEPVLVPNMDVISTVPEPVTPLNRECQVSSLEEEQNNLSTKPITPHPPLTREEEQNDLSTGPPTPHPAEQLSLLCQ